MNTSKYDKAIDLLKSLIQIPSFSKEEDQTAEVIENWLKEKGIATNRLKNNIWALNKYFDPSKPTILLNSHHDTVKPNNAYTRDPFTANIEDGKLYGLGSNDAGGCLVSLMSVFLHFYDREDLSYNFVLAATAEEEISGKNGIALLLPELPPLAFAVVGEPTEMYMAIAEKGLMVIDGYAKGLAGHAAHDNTENAIDNAMEDINWIQNYEFPKISEQLGKVKMNVTQIEAGEQHNVVPATCHFVVDVRINELYTNEEVYAIMNEHTKSELKARSFRLNSSSIPLDHPFVQAGKALGLIAYGSPTLSDQALMSCPSVKIGPGKSLRSHSADEYIELKEIKEGIESYVRIFEEILK